MPCPVAHSNQSSRMLAVTATGDFSGTQEATWMSRPCILRGIQVASCAPWKSPAAFTASIRLDCFECATGQGIQSRRRSSPEPPPSAFETPQVKFLLLGSLRPTWLSRLSVGAASQGPAAQPTSPANPGWRPTLQLMLSTCCIPVEPPRPLLN